MKLLNFEQNGQLKLGVHTSKGVLDVKAATEKMHRDVPTTFHEVLQGGKEAVQKLHAYVEGLNDDALFTSIEAIEYGPAVPKPGKLICVGLNYKKHAEESNMPIPEYPILFNKFGNTITAHQKPIELPPNAEQIDYEAELGIVIGKRAKFVEKDKALDYVLGYCNVNDLSARDLQFRTNQWLLGKCLDDFSPIGPYIVTTDEVGDPNNLNIRCFVNGEVRQNSNTKDMIFNCDEIVSYISQYMTLEPGDVISTGTPSGVISGYPEDERVWLKAGDEVTIEIEKLGSLTNRMTK